MKKDDSEEIVYEKVEHENTAEVQRHTVKKILSLERRSACKRVRRRKDNGR